MNKPKIAIVTSTRPELIRLSEVIKKCSNYFDLLHIYTNQNYEDSLSKQFFEEFNIKPDIVLSNELKLNGIEFISQCMKKINVHLKNKNIDMVLVLGDTNGALAVVNVAKRLKIPIFHMEAGTRCYDDLNVPEEINRKQIDRMSDWHLCYTQRSREQLLLEGYLPNKIIVIGNPIYEVLKKYDKGNETAKKHILVTLHRKENIENKNRLKNIFESLSTIKQKVIVSAHPSLISRLIECKLYNYVISLENISFFTPTNFQDFIKLEKNAICVITDSGTVPEECSILNIPCILIRYSTERPELLENNSMIVCSNHEDLNCALNISINENTENPVHPDYDKPVSNNVIKLLMRYNDVQK